MELEEYGRIAAVEDDHWWYRATRRLMADLLGPQLGAGLRIVDVGCGPGGNSAWLGAHGTVIGVDRAAEALRFVRQHHRATRVTQAEAGALPVADGVADLVLDLTMLYAVDDDRAAVHEIARVLRPGGRAFMLEPAFEAFRRAHDRTVHGRRRYRRHELAGLATDAGLEVHRATYAYSFLAPAALALGLADRAAHRDPGAGEPSPSDLERPALGSVFARLAAIEHGWLRRHDLRIGTSAVVVAAKPA